MMHCVKPSTADDRRENILRRAKPRRHGDRKLTPREVNEMRSSFWRSAPQTYGGQPGDFFHDQIC
ncbi:hypothetical protein HanRHA438_Chr15g0708831 [Helianthus annuus]|nr:hypothetical protein HanHA300_Chr15g0567651 [Helianthus annuus]KAJ0473326.1 hypothetical protein HanHA89_Chr15g0617031 [Helianthus annuus]KAJ0648908.1 hypothetical protein HanLR1_Chr15g0578161 [Helianthus annuus]KAJ0652715.1 hypothetical protein HanOQP8_Chr15g0575291 [Helianthus annuus]KAJ0845013.1 hypothetical protein HanRHA438_Chr15g0708831 [Helianthus annuus]